MLAPTMIYLVAATRPNFMKIAPIYRALKARGRSIRLLHTGQHFDTTMSDVFFRDLGLPTPDVTLKAGGGSHAEQTAAVLVGTEADLLANRPAIVVVDSMQTGPAIRVYNIMMGERRRVAAGLIAVP